MTSDILLEMQKNLKQMENLISDQTFKVADAHKFLARYFNFARKIEQLEASRDNWKKKYIELKQKVGVF